MSVAVQEEKVYKKGLLKKPQTATVIAHRAGFEVPQQIATALHNLVQAGWAVRHADRRYSKV